MAAKPVEERSLRQLLFWSYANLAMAHAAVSKSEHKYGRVHFMIRARQYAGLCQGRMTIGSLLDEERLKLTLPRACSYCGGSAKLTVDHLMPRALGGPETADNVVWACGACNSSKRDADFFDWWPRSHSSFPPLMLIRRYLKVALVVVEQRGLAEVLPAQALGLPFVPSSIPLTYPPPVDCVMWIPPRESD